MTMKELSRYSDKELAELEHALIEMGSMTAACRVGEVRDYYHKQVKVVKGRKVPHGVTGECFWMGETDYSKHGDPWGIYTSVRVGIRDSDGAVYWTALDNVELV